MVTLDQWKANKEWQQTYDSFIRSDTGAAFKQVLISMMLDQWPDLSISADILNIEAVSSASMKGYRRCYKNLELLNTAKPSDPLPVMEFTSTGLPLSPEVKARVDAKMPKKRV